MCLMYSLFNSFHMKLNYRTAAWSINVCSCNSGGSLVYYEVFIISQTPWEDVRKEMVDEKGLAPEAADRIGEYVKLSGKFCVIVGTVLKVTCMWSGIFQTVHTQAL